MKNYKIYFNNKKENKTFFENIKALNFDEAVNIACSFENENVEISINETVKEFFNK